MITGHRRVWPLAVKKQMIVCQHLNQAYQNPGDQTVVVVEQELYREMLDVMYRNMAVSEQTLYLGWLDVAYPKLHRELYKFRASA